MQIIIQARINSARLYRKVLYPINGKTLLEYLITRLTYLKNYKICIATSNQTHDDEIENFCNVRNIKCYRGSLNDVAKRILDAVEHLKAKAFIRINGDSPFIDPKIIDQGIKIYENGKYDLVTNTFPRSFPVGQSVEIVSTSAFQKACKKMSHSDHFEHVTKYFYDNPNDFKIQNFSNDKDLSKFRLVVDSIEDLERIKLIVSKMTKPIQNYSLDELIDLYPPE